MLDIDKDAEFYGKIKPLIGEKRVPLKLNVMYQAQNNQFIAYMDMTLRDLRLQLEK